MGLSQPIAVVAGGHHSAHPVFRRGAAPEKVRNSPLRQAQGKLTGGNNSLQRVRNGAVNVEDILKKRIDALENWFIIV